VTEKRYYMACLDLEGRECLVVGTGSMAEEKAAALAECGGRVRTADDYRGIDELDGVWLVVAATADRALGERVAFDAAARKVFCNVADMPDLCTFILPAVARRDPLVIGVSTSGASPALAQRIRDEVAERYGERHAALARRLRDLRPWARERFPTYEERRDYFRDLVATELES
jgi:siroheme synthase-like protein